ncbi:MAG TPA: cyclic nucleotide-binding domain-containing protein [Solirubrobacteraceae bacterium]|jgi:CRP-like cAMP-binding protein|nr:cyclic nucleotide-binding domain-containing protein [Solirubrobacteraceae bacterium]
MLQAQLKGVPFFSGLSKHELDAVAREVDELDFPAGRVLIRQGEFGHEFFVIVEGAAEVLQGDAVIAQMGPGDFFGELALLDEERRTATVRATSPMRVLVMTRQSFRALDRAVPGIHAKIADAITGRQEHQAD